MLKPIDLFAVTFDFHSNVTRNQFLANYPISYPLKTPENQSISSVFREYKIVALVRDELKVACIFLISTKKILTNLKQTLNPLSANPAK